MEAMEKEVDENSDGKSDGATVEKRSLKKRERKRQPEIKQSRKIAQRSKEKWGRKARLVAMKTAKGRNGMKMGAGRASRLCMTATDRRSTAVGTLARPRTRRAWEPKDK